jgi:DNA gyrase subunit A
MVRDLEMPTLPFTPELDRAYRLYAAKTIEDRALPDVRDGCKPVQRRILYAMHDMGLRADRPQRKCARIVGEVLGKYHPHGDQSVYGSLVRMAQPFAQREVLIDGQGNFGSIDGDGAAAMRYTEARLSPVGELLLSDIDADTVDFADNFDNSLREPMVLPTAFPNLLVNGASGIAVGMATNIPPHNLGEVADAIGHLVRHWARRESIDAPELMRFVPGPDFPTGGLVYRWRDEGAGPRDSILDAYSTGQGRMIVQARMHIEPAAGGKAHIIITELPYNVQKSTLLERIAREVKDGRIGGVSDLRDESDYDDGLRVVVEAGRGADPQKVMTDLLKYSQLQETFGCIALALVPDGGGLRPRLLSLRQMLVYFVAFRLTVIERRTRHELARRRDRLHIVEGLLKALAEIDEVVRIIRGSKTPDAAREGLMAKLALSEVQASAILDMPLRRLTALEIGKLKDEAAELKTRIKQLEALLASETLRLEVVAQETADIKARFATPRRTVILDAEDAVAGNRVVTESQLRQPGEPQALLLTTAGIERRPAAGYRYLPGDGLTGRATASLISKVTVPPTGEVLLLSSQGRAWRQAVGFVPEKADAKELGLERGESLVAALVLPEPPAATLGDGDAAGAGETGGQGEDAGATPQVCLVLGSRSGRVKRTLLSDLGLTPGHWTTVLGLVEKGDELLFAAFAPDAADILFGTTAGQLLRTPAADVNPQASGSARGVAGIGLKGADKLLIGGVVPAEAFDKTAVYIVSEKGLVKRVPLAEYPSKGRGTGGVITLNVTAATGKVAALAIGPLAGDLDLLFANGRRQHIPAAHIPTVNRYQQGKALGLLKEAEAAVVGAVVL